MAGNLISSQVFGEVVQSGSQPARVSTSFNEVVQTGPSTSPARVSQSFNEVVQYGQGLNARVSTLFVEVVRSFPAPISGYVSLAEAKGTVTL